MITRANGQRKVDYRKLHNMQSVEPTKRKKSTKHRPAVHRQHKANGTSPVMRFFTDQVNTIVVNLMNRRHSMYHMEREFKVDHLLAKKLVSMYRLNNKYKPCRNFMKNHNIVSKVYKNEINYTEISDFQCKIRKTRDVRFFDENMKINEIPKQFNFCFKFQLTPIVAFNQASS
jgi:hypothetical protein